VKQKQLRDESHFSLSRLLFLREKTGYPLRHGAVNRTTAFILWIQNNFFNLTDKANMD
jgi:hypothetical protein